MVKMESESEMAIFGLKVMVKRFSFEIPTWGKGNKFVKFIYSEKATKFCEISTNYLSYVLPVK